MNADLAQNIETLFLISRAEKSHISSSIIRDIIKNKGNASRFLPKEITIKKLNKMRIINIILLVPILSFSQINVNNSNLPSIGDTTWPMNMAAIHKEVVVLIKTGTFQALMVVLIWFLDLLIQILLHMPVATFLIVTFVFK